MALSRKKIFKNENKEKKMTPLNPLVSIITPVYNAQKYIAQAINSVLSQTYKNWELIIINDGSSDNTEDIINSFCDERIIVISQSNGGVSSARNRGLEIARGEYITFLDGDDILPINSLKVRVDYLEKNPNIDLVDGRVSVKNITMQKETREYMPYFRGYILDRLLSLDSRVFFNVSYLFRANIVGDIRFKSNLTHGEDLIFYIDIAQKKDIHYSFVSDEVYWYREGDISAMSDIDGLERGYLFLLNYLQNISLKQKLYLRYKVAKILFLSWWFDAKNPKRAIASFFKVIKSI